MDSTLSNLLLSGGGAAARGGGSGRAAAEAAGGDGGGRREGEGQEEQQQKEKEAPLRLCEWPADLEGNCTLAVAGRDVHVNKAVRKYLSMHSPVLHQIFYGDFAEKAQNKFEVNAVDADAFIEMLRVILPARKPIDEKNVESLLVIADRFMMDALRKECVSFLCSDAESAKAISCVVLIVLAFTYSIDELKPRVSARLPTKESVYALRHCPRYEEINNEARVWLFNLLMARPDSQSMKRVLCNDRCRAFDCEGRCKVCGAS